MKAKWFAAAVVAILFLAVAARAQAPVTHSFTLAPKPILTVIPGQSYDSYNLLTFDGATASGSEVEHLDTGLYDFTLPGISLLNCSASSSTLGTHGPGQTVVTTTIFTCSGAGSLTTTLVEYDVAAACSGRGAYRRCWRVGSETLSGSLTEE
jgi:hypothetical protein